MPDTSHSPHWSGANAELVEFDSMGSTCRGWLFLPAKLPAAVVVLGHGLGGTKECGLGVVAEDFSKDGWAALAIDYRGFGQSEPIIGEPTCYFHVLRVAEDFVAAVDFARGHDSLDSTRVVLFGFSMGGHGAAIAAVMLQERATEVQGLMMVAPKVVPKDPVNCCSAFCLRSPVRFLYAAWKILGSCCCCCCDVRVKQHMTSPDDTLAVMTDSHGSWPIIPGGHQNEISAQFLYHALCPSCEVRQFNSKLCTLQAAVLLVSGVYDLHLATAPHEVRFRFKITLCAVSKLLSCAILCCQLRRLFEGKPIRPAELLEVPGDHCSCLPMVNQEAYNKHKETYTDPCDTYVPEVYPDHELPAFRAFLASLSQPGFPCAC